MKIDVISSFVNGEFAEYLRNNMLSLATGNYSFRFENAVDKLIGSTDWDIIIDMG